MANTPITEMDRKQILRLKANGMSIRQISQDLGLHRKTVSQYLTLCDERKITYEDLKNIY